MLSQYTDIQLVDCLVKIDWSKGANNKLKKLLPTDDEDNETESRIYVFIKEMKEKGYIASGASTTISIQRYLLSSANY